MCTNLQNSLKAEVLTEIRIKRMKQKKCQAPREFSREKPMHKGILYGSLTKTLLKPA